MGQHDVQLDGRRVFLELRLLHCLFACFKLLALEHIGRRHHQHLCGYHGRDEV